LLGKSRGKVGNPQRADLDLAALEDENPDGALGLALEEGLLALPKRIPRVAG
jgi:hypothetical protein